jgi:hypothetical protein
MRRVLWKLPIHLAALGAGFWMVYDRHDPPSSANTSSGVPAAATVASSGATPAQGAGLKRALVALAAANAAPRTVKIPDQLSDFDRFALRDHRALVLRNALVLHLSHQSLRCGGSQSDPSMLGMVFRVRSTSTAAVVEPSAAMDVVEGAALSPETDACLRVALSERIQLASEAGEVFPTYEGELDMNVMIGGRR